jgi:hypothetical protein
VGGDDSSGEGIRIEPYMPYLARPIDDSSVKLPEDLDRITDRLAEKAHEIWAAKRLAEGWKLGPKKRRQPRRDPLLVPYAELPESEKQSDKDLVVGTLRAVLALGYCTEKSRA